MGLSRRRASLELFSFISQREDISLLLVFFGSVKRLVLTLDSRRMCCI